MHVGGDTLKLCAVECDSKYQNVKLLLCKKCIQIELITYLPSGDIGGVLIEGSEVV